MLLCAFFHPLLLIFNSDTNWLFICYLKAYFHLTFKQMSFSDMQEPDKYSNSPDQRWSLLMTPGASLPFTPTAISFSLSLFFFYELQVAPLPSPELFKGLWTWLINTFQYLKRGTISLISFSFLMSSSRAGAHRVPIIPITNLTNLEMSRAPFSASCFIKSRSRTSVIWLLSLVWPGNKKDRRLWNGKFLTVH